MDAKQELISAAEYYSIRDILDFSNTDLVDPSAFYISLIAFMNNEKTYPRQVIRDRALKSLAEGEQKIRDEIETLSNEWGKLLETENALRRNIPSADNTRKLQENLLEQEDKKYAKRILRKQKTLKKPSIDVYLDSALATEENRQKLLTVKDSKLVEEHITSGNRSVLGPFAVASVTPFWESYTHGADSKTELPAIAVLQKQLIQSEDERMPFCCTQIQRNMLLMFICCEFVRAFFDGKERDRSTPYKIPSATDLPADLASPKSKPIKDLSIITADYLEQANENLRVLLSNFIELNGYQTDDTEPMALLQVLSNYIENLLGKSHSHLGRSGRGPAQDLQGKLVGFKEWIRQSVHTLSHFIATVDMRLKTMQNSSVQPYTVAQLLYEAQPKETTRTDSQQNERGTSLFASSTPLFKASESVKAHSHRSSKHRRGTLTGDPKNSPRMDRNTDADQDQADSPQSSKLSSSPSFSPGRELPLSPSSRKDSTGAWHPALSRHRGDSHSLQAAGLVDGQVGSPPRSPAASASSSLRSSEFVVGNTQKSSRSSSGAAGSPPTSNGTATPSAPRKYDISAAVNAARVSAGTVSPPGSPGQSQSPYNNPILQRPPSSGDVAAARLTRDNSKLRLPKYNPDGSLYVATPPSPSNESSRKLSKGAATATAPITIPAANPQSSGRKMPGSLTSVDNSAFTGPLARTGPDPNKDTHASAANNGRVNAPGPPRAGPPASPVK